MEQNKASRVSVIAKDLFLKTTSIYTEEFDHWMHGGANLLRGYHPKVPQMTKQFHPSIPPFPFCHRPPMVQTIVRPTSIFLAGDDSLGSSRIEANLTASILHF